MKISKILMLLVSIGFIVFGSVFIADGVQTTTETTAHYIAPKTAGNQDQSSTKSVKSNEIKSDSRSAAPKQKIPKKSDNGSSSVNTKINISADSDSSSSDSMNPSSSSDSDSSFNSDSAEAGTTSTSGQQENPEASGSSTSHSSASNAADSSNQELISIEVKGYDNKDISGHVAFTDGLTAFHALQMLTDSKNIELDYSGSGSTVYVKGINGQSAGDKSAQSGWIYKVNGKSPNVSAGICELQDGDTLVWTYQE